VDQRHDKHAVWGDPVDQSIRLYQQFPNRLVADFRHDLTTLRELRASEAAASFTFWTKAAA
jgi:hypothetical protein